MYLTMIRNHKLAKRAVSTLGNKVEIWKIKYTRSTDRDSLVIYSGHG